MVKARNKRLIDVQASPTESNQAKKSKINSTSISSSAILKKKNNDELKAAPVKSTNNPPVILNITEHDFDANDFEFLSKNENFRYLTNSKYVGHAVIKNDNEDNKVAYQFPIPQSGKSLHVLPLAEIETIDRYGQQRFQAKTPDGTTMFAKRVLDIEFNEGNYQEQMQIACFSPTRDDKEPFWGGGDDVALFREDLRDQEKLDLEKELQELPLVVKGGQELEIDHASVKYRDINRTRTPHQNTIIVK